MKALTIWQPWASLIMAGAKPYEFRRWPAPRSIIGQRIVVHAGARAVKAVEVQELMLDLERRPAGSGYDICKTMDLLDHWGRSRNGLPLAAGLGTAILGEPKRCTDLFAHVVDRDDIDGAMWAWPLSDIKPFEPPVPARGAQGFWNWATA